MSFAEIKAEIEKLTPEQKKELRDALEVEISGADKIFATTFEYLGSLRETVIFHPGWDENEPVEDWKALR